MYCAFVEFNSLYAWHPHEKQQTRSKNFFFFDKFKVYSLFENICE